MVNDNCFFFMTCFALTYWDDWTEKSLWSVTHLHTHIPTTFGLLNALLVTAVLSPRECFFHSFAIVVSFSLGSWELLITFYKLFCLWLTYSVFVLLIWCLLFFQLSWLSLPILYWNSECTVLTRWLCTFLTLGIFSIFLYYLNTCPLTYLIINLIKST